MRIHSRLWVAGHSGVNALYCISPTGNGRPDLPQLDLTSPILAFLQQYTADQTACPKANNQELDSDN